MRGWANYFKHAVCKHTLGTLDNFAWWQGDPLAQNPAPLEVERRPPGTSPAPTAGGAGPSGGRDRAVQPRERCRSPGTATAATRSPAPGHCQPRLTAETVESPLPGNGHGGFGERPGETDREQSRHRAPGRLNHGKRSAPIRGTDPQRGFRPGTINVCDARDQALARHPEPTQTSSVCSGPGVNHTEVHREASPSPGEPGWTWHTSDQMEIRSDHHG